MISSDLGGGMKSKEQVYLKELTVAVSLFLGQFDLEMSQTLITPAQREDRGKRLASLANSLNYANDMARHFGLDIDLKTGKKQKPGAG